MARNVFKPAFYEALEQQVHSLLQRGLSEAPAVGRFSRNLPGYDAYATGFGTADEGPISLFFSHGWRDMLCDLWMITKTPYVFVGAHHHAPGSGSGFIHNDFNPVWFPRTSDDRIQMPDQNLCSYKTGVGTLDDADKVQVVRGAAFLLFVANGAWWPGDGGEIGLYQSADQGIARPTTTCAPVDNTVVTFECTPESFHGYLANRRASRTSIIMWVHRPLEEAVKRFGAERLERWKS